VATLGGRGCARARIPLSGAFLLDPLKHVLMAAARGIRGGLYAKTIPSVAHKTCEALQIATQRSLVARDLVYGVEPPKGARAVDHPVQQVPALPIYYRACIANRAAAQGRTGVQAASIRGGAARDVQQRVGVAHLVCPKRAMVVYHGVPRAAYATEHGYGEIVDVAHNHEDEFARQRVHGFWYCSVCPFAWLDGNAPMCARKRDQSGRLCLVSVLLLTAN